MILIQIKNKTDLDFLATNCFNFFILSTFVVFKQYWNKIYYKSKIYL
ncbi:unnamed protein product [Paramecium octaurelia]|uniref:Uncharacterized protein n=1 Tax=Paramecium octaurelia TaxID=43137 RepID=A0A8S1UIT8_PAROT|nr:unnamed protein product [Paramecium octaurelia]